MTTVSEDIPAVERVLIDGIEQGLVAVLQIVIVAGFMFYADATLAWTAMLPMPFLALGAVLYTKSARDRHRKVRTASSGIGPLYPSDPADQPTPFTPRGYHVTSDITK